MILTVAMVELVTGGWCRRSVIGVESGCRLHGHAVGVGSFSSYRLDCLLKSNVNYKLKGL